jgi:hypothetical protein
LFDSQPKREVGECPSSAWPEELQADQGFPLPPGRRVSCLPNLEGFCRPNGEREALLILLLLPGLHYADSPSRPNNPTVFSGGQDALLKTSA